MADGPPVFRRMGSGEVIDRDDPGFDLVEERYLFVRDTLPLLNSATSEERRRLFATIFGTPFDPSVDICTQFRTDFGLFTTIGRNTFVNGGCTFLDQEG